MSKKKPGQETEAVEPEKIISSLYTCYIIRLQEDFNEYKKGKTLEATLLPVIVDRKNDKWENKWFVYEGERFIGHLPKETDVMTLVSVKKGKK